MIGNLMTVTVDQFIKGTLKRGVPGNYLAVVSSIDEEFRLRDLLWKEIQKIAEDGNHVIEEIDYYQARFHKYKVCGADINNKKSLVQINGGAEAWYSNEELEMLKEETRDISAKMEAKLPEGKTGIALYKDLRPDPHYLSLLTTDCVPKNWLVFGVLCDGDPEVDASEIWSKLKSPFTARVTL